MTTTPSPSDSQGQTPITNPYRRDQRGQQATPTTPSNQGASPAQTQIVDATSDNNINRNNNNNNNNNTTTRSSDISTATPMDDSNDQSSPPADNSNANASTTPTSSSTYAIPLITADTKCHWLICELPIADEKFDLSTGTTAYISVLIKTASKMDPTFSLIHTLIPPEGIPTLSPISSLLNRAILANTELTSQRAKEFYRTTKEHLFIQKPIKPKPDSNKTIALGTLHLEVHIATQAPIPTLLDHLVQSFRPNCARIRLHPINHCKMYPIGVLIYGTSTVDQQQLETTIALQAAPIHIRMDSFIKELGIATPPTLKKVDSSTLSIITISTAKKDISAVKRYLSTSFPRPLGTNATSLTTYPTLRRMEFMDKLDYTENQDHNPTYLAQAAITHQTFATNEQCWRTTILLPLHTVVNITATESRSIKQILLSLTTPFRKGFISTASNQPIFYDAVPGSDDPGTTFVYYMNQRRTEAIVTFTNLDRAIEIAFGDASIISSTIKPHERPYSQHSDTSRLNRFSGSEPTSLSASLDAPPIANPFSTSLQQFLPKHANDRQSLAFPPSNKHPPPGSSPRRSQADAKKRKQQGTPPHASETDDSLGTTDTQSPSNMEFLQHCSNFTSDRPSHYRNRPQGRGARGGRGRTLFNQRTPSAQAAAPTTAPSATSSQLVARPPAWSTDLTTTHQPQHATTSDMQTFVTMIAAQFADQRATNLSLRDQLDNSNARHAMDMSDVRTELRAIRAELRENAIANTRRPQNNSDPDEDMDEFEDTAPDHLGNLK